MVVFVLWSSCGIYSYTNWGSTMKAVQWWMVESAALHLIMCVRTNCKELFSYHYDPYKSLIISNTIKNKNVSPRRWCMWDILSALKLWYKLMTRVGRKRIATTPTYPRDNGYNRFHIHLSLHRTMATLNITTTKVLDDDHDLCVRPP